MEIVRDFDVDAYWNKKEAELERCPVCHFCRQHIQTEKMIARRCPFFQQVQLESSRLSV